MNDVVRVCFLIRCLEAGGAERQLVELLAGLDRRAFDLTVLTFYGGGAFWPEVSALPGVKLVSLEKRKRWDVLPFLWRLWREVRLSRPQVVVGYLSIANELALIVGRLSGARVVWRIGAAFMDLSQYDWLSRASFRASAWLSRWPDLTIVNSQEGRRHHGEQGYATARMLVVANGYDVDRFRPDRARGTAVRQAWAVGRDEPLVGLVARIDPIKDHRTFLEAAVLAARALPSLRFACVGGGDAGYVAAVREHARRLAIDGRIIWTGERDDMPAVYNALDLMTLCSRGEGLPNAVGEAMACAIPCVVTDVGDARLLLGEGGLVVPARDPRALADAWLSLLARSPAERAETGQRGRRRIVEQFNRERLSDRTAAVLRDLGHRRTVTHA